MNGIVDSAESDPNQMLAQKEVEVIEFVPPPVVGDVTIVGPSTIVSGTKEYKYNYTGNGDVTSEVWSIINVDGDESKYSIDANGVLTSEESVSLPLAQLDNRTFRGHERNRCCGTSDYGSNLGWLPNELNHMIVTLKGQFGSSWSTGHVQGVIDLDSNSTT